MKKLGRLKENVVTALEIPADLAYREPIVTLTGPGQVIIENYKTLLQYTTEKVVVLTPKGRVSVCGKRLEIPFYTPWEMQVTGRIFGIFLEGQGV